MAPPPRLSNCFVPAVADDDAGDENDTKADGLRPIQIQTNLLPSAAGSALVQHGDSHVLCAVIGPTASQKLQKQSVPLDVDEGTLVVEVKYLLPNAAATGGTPLNAQQQHRESYQATQQLEQQLSQHVLACLQPIVPLHTFPKSAVTVRIDVWHRSSGTESLLTTALLAAVAALASIPGMELYNLVTACTVAVHEDGSTFVVDPASSSGIGSVTLAVVPPSSVCVWEQRGMVPPAALQACREGCVKWHKILRNYLVTQHGKQQQTLQQ